MAESSQPDFSFIQDDMTPNQMNGAYRQAYLRLWEQGLGMVESWQEEIDNLTREKTEWQRQEQFGIKVVEHLRAQLHYYEEKYPNDRPPFANESEAIISQYDSIRSHNSNNDNNNSHNNNDNNNSKNEDSSSTDLLNVFANNNENNAPLSDPHKLKHELFLERRASEYLRQECDDLQTEMQVIQARENQIVEETEKQIVNVANRAWEQQLYSVFEQIAEQGHDIGSLKIDFDIPNDDTMANENENGNFGNGDESGNGGRQNLTGDPHTVSEVRGMRKNLVRLYTKTDWNPNELLDLKDEMMSQMNQLHKGKMAKMTYNPNIMPEEAPIDDSMFNNNNNNNNSNNYDSNGYDMEAMQAQGGQVDVNKYKKQYEEVQAKLGQLEREYSQKISENEEGLRVMRDQLNDRDERCEMLIQSKIDFINAVSTEMQHLRDMIRWYNPDEKYRHIIDKIVRYHDLAPAQGNALFQLIENANLPVSQIANKRRKSEIASASIGND